MRKLGLAVLCAVAACSSAPRLPQSADGAPVIEVRGAVREGARALGAADLDRLPHRTLRGTDPRSGAAAQWEGPSVAALVSDRIRIQKGADTAVVRTADGSAVPVPLTVIRQLRPVLAERVDGVRLAARVLAWPTEEQIGLATDPRAASWWAHDVVAFEIVDWQRTFAPALAPPEGSADAARRGGFAFGESCISCHRVRGVGGEKGPDLTAVAARLREEPFVAALQRHPGWSHRRAEQPRAEAASELWSFLSAVAAGGAGGTPPEMTAGRAAPVANSP